MRQELTLWKRREKKVLLGSMKGQESITASKKCVIIEYIYCILYFIILNTKNKNVFKSQLPIKLKSPQEVLDYS